MDIELIFFNKNIAVQSVRSRRYIKPSLRAVFNARIRERPLVEQWKSTPKRSGRIKDERIPGHQGHKNKSRIAQTGKLTGHPDLLRILPVGHDSETTVKTTGGVVLCEQLFKRPQPEHDEVWTNLHNP